MTHRLLAYYSIPVLESKVTIITQSHWGQERTLAEQIHRALSNWRTRQDAAILGKLLQNLQVFCTRCLAVLDRGAFVHHHHVVWVLYKEPPRSLRTTRRGKGFDIHYKYLQTIKVFHQELFKHSHVSFCGLWIPTHDAALDAFR